LGGEEAVEAVEAVEADEADRPPDGTTRRELLLLTETDWTAPTAPLPTIQPSVPSNHVHERPDPRRG
jgi:hypothetical protein